VIAVFNSLLVAALRLALHLVGLYVLGPHNWLLRVRRERIERKWKERTEAYDRADAWTKEGMLRAERQRLRSQLEREAKRATEAERKKKARLGEGLYSRDLLRRRLRRDCKWLLRNESLRTPKGPYGETQPDRRLANARPLESSPSLYETSLASLVPRS
tara:strand:+ start:460 stop:936 length:477 start_codon:yes stop_codon:yes gene_type:complete